MRAPWVDVRFLFKTAREQSVWGPGVWCDWDIRNLTEAKTWHDEFTNILYALASIKSIQWSGKQDEVTFEKIQYPGNLSSKQQTLTDA